MATTPLFVGVDVVCNVEFKVGTKGVASTKTEMVTPKELTSLSMSIDGGVEEWTPMDSAGWLRRLVTAKNWTMSIAGKRYYGDPGNDYLDSLKFAIGQDASTKISIGLPDGSTIEQNVVANITEVFGESTAVSALGLDLMSDGAPTITPPSS